MTKIGKYIPFGMLILAIIITACSSENENSELKSEKLSLNTFETFKGQLIDINTINTSRFRTNSRLEQNNYILSQVNDFHNTDIDFEDSLKELDSTDEIFNWLKANTSFNQTDIDILTSFSSNLTTLSFDNAVSILENEISNRNLDSYKFEKYQSIVNGIALIEHQYPGFFTIESTQARGGWGCAWAVAKLALASASLVAACNPPALGATVGTGCYLAAAGFVAASASVGMACGDD